MKLNESQTPSETMPDLTETRISGETIFEGHVFKVEYDKVACANGIISEREVVRHNGGVGILAIDSQDNVIMVRQYRYAQGKIMLEIPAGKLEPNEDPEPAGRRELSEETGITCGYYCKLGQIVPTGAYCSETITLYLALDLTYGQPHPDDGEFICAEKVPLKKLEEMIWRGEVIDCKTIAAIYYYNLWLKLNGGKTGRTIEA